MSFMTVSGKVYHCEKCQLDLAVEYEGGPSLTQVSDPVILDNKELDRTYGSRSGVVNRLQVLGTLINMVFKVVYKEFDQKYCNPGGAGKSLHVPGICNRCFAALPEAERTRSAALARAISAAEQLADAFNRHSKLAGETTQSVVDRWLQSVDAQSGWSAFDPVAFGDTIGAYGFEKRGQRRKSAAVRTFVERAGRPILTALGAAVEADQDIQKLRSDFETATEGLREGALSALRQSAGARWVTKEIYGPENLNPYISNEFSWRTPLRGSAKSRKRGVLALVARQHAWIPCHDTLFHLKSQTDTEQLVAFINQFDPSRLAKVDEATLFQAVRRHLEAEMGIGDSQIPSGVSTE